MPSLRPTASMRQPVWLHGALLVRCIHCLVWLPCLAVMLGLWMAPAASAQTLQLNPGEFFRGIAPGGAQAPEVAPRPEYAAVNQGYLYLEPGLLRFEVLVDAPTALKWAGLELPETLDDAAQKALITAAQEKAASWFSAGTDKLQTASFTGTTLIRGKPGATLPLDEGAAVPLGEAMLGLMWELPLPPLYESLLLKWEGYIAERTVLPILALYGSKSERLQAEKATTELRWKPEGRLPKPQPLAAAPALSAPPPWRLPLASVLWLSLGLVVLQVCRTRGARLPGGTATFFTAWFIGALLSWPLLVIPISRSVSIPSITEKGEAEAIVSPLLKNIYRAFDHRGEEAIYDTLALSAHGELLRKLYLETQQALTLEGREGTRVRITEFSAEVLGVKENPAGAGFTCDCQWTALGTVGHWGHSHTRVNRYSAEVTVAPVGEGWKIVNLEVKEARRI